MKFDFESLSSEPLIYMLLHSGAFVCVLGFIFFVVGLLFGYATWGRYKRISRELRGSAESMKEEIAVLKRKVGDHSVKPGPAIAMATETISMPKKEGVTAAEAVPAITEETITTRDSRPPTSQILGASTRSRLPKSRANIIKAKAASPAPLPTAEISTPDGRPTPEPPSSEPATASTTLSPAETPPPPAPARHSSPLAAIIAAPPVKEEPGAEGETTAAAPAGLVPADTIPALTDLVEAPALNAAPENPLPADNAPASVELAVAPLPAVEVQPEFDPKLGLVYKTRPETADDLTALRGIAHVLEQRLHEIGIYTYAQIAAWDDDRIKEFSIRLAFKDRIQRERWVEQARMLAARKTTV